MSSDKKEASEFPWEYDQQETCLIIAGEVTVTNGQGERFDFGAGDWVVFPKGLTCRWKIKKHVQKHYHFG